MHHHRLEQKVHSQANEVNENCDTEGVTEAQINEYKEEEEEGRG